MLLRLGALRLVVVYVSNIDYTGDIWEFAKQINEKNSASFYPLTPLLVC
jgi:hypothetical protein